jgi:hypothetical protein
MSRVVMYWWPNVQKTFVVKKSAVVSVVNCNSSLAGHENAPFIGSLSQCILRRMHLYRLEYIIVRVRSTANGKSGCEATLLKALRKYKDSQK